jgi:hypothetical protein
MAGTSGRRTGQGRKSPEARVVMLGPGMARPAPPEEFDAPERAVWHKITNSCPPDWFGPECQPLLARLCMLHVMAEELETELRANNNRFADKKDYAAYLDTLKQVANLSTKLRLTPQSRFNRLEAGSRMKNRATYRPWQTDEDDGPSCAS